MSSKSVEPVKENEIEENAGPDPLWSEVRDDDIGKGEIPAELGEREIPLEWTEEQERIDDSIHMYLHEIGRVHLLTAEERSFFSQTEREGQADRRD